MKWVSSVLLTALLAWSAFANTQVDRQVSLNQITAKTMEQSFSSTSTPAGSGATRDLRNGNFALACQTEDGTYLTNMLNYIYSPVLTLPAGSNVFFDFQIRGEFSDPDAFPDVDYWGCEVSPDAGVTWFYISNPYGDPDGNNYVYSDAPADWSSFVNSYSVDGQLNDYAGDDLRFRWYFQSDDDTPIGEGIFLDDVLVTVDGATVLFADFEDGDLTGWESEDATATPPLWHQTTVGAFSGQSWAMNDSTIGTAGGYLDHWYQTFDSPAVTLPAGQVNTITFQQNRSVEALGTSGDYNGWDGTNVRISVDDGATWEVLTDVTPAYNSSSMYSFGFEFGEGVGVPGWGGASGAWEPVTITIPSMYDGGTVRIRWAFASDPAYNTTDQADMFGWIIDDIDIAGVVTNDGETGDGWEAASQVPIAGDLWHLAFVGALPVPISVAAEAGDSQVDVTWGAPISGETTEIMQDNQSAWRYFLNDSQPYGVMFEATEDNSYLGAAKFFMATTGTAFEGTIDAYVYSVGADGLPDELLYTREGVAVAAYPSATSVDLSGTGLVFNTGEKFTLCVGNFAASDQGVLADSISTENPASGNSVVWGGDAWYPITDAYTDIANLAIRAEIIIPDAGFAPESYNVYRRTAASEFGDALVAELNAVEYLDTGVSNGETYYYAVSANYSNGESPLSEAVIAEPESQTVVEMAYDDGTAEYGFNLGSGSYQAVKFTPTGYPTLIKRIKIFSDDTDDGNAIAYIWDDNGPNGAPLDEFGRYGWSYLQPGWNVMDLTADSIWIDGGSFYFGVKELGSTPSIGADTDGGYAGNSYYGVVDGTDLVWDNMSGLGLEYNLMYRVDIDTAFVMVGIDSQTGGNLPSSYTLEQNYPNPFNPSTEINYALPAGGQVELKVFDLNGREIDVLVQEYQPAGSHRLHLDGSHMDSGIYIYTLSTDDVHLTRKMILLK